jgi:long-chain fatty acid transport protein
MKRTFMAGIAALIGIMVCSSTSFASGFRLPEQDSAAMGMSSAFVGQADNPSAVWYNPAGITQLDGTQISGGVIGIYPVLTHENNTVNPGTTDVSERDVHLPVQFYATHKVNDAVFIGFGVNNPFGLATDWDPNSSTKYVATFSKVVTTEINPNVAFKLNDNLSAAFGFDYVLLRATLEKTVNVGGPSPAADRNFRLNGDDHGWGFNAAALYKFSQSLKAGVSYRSRVKVDIDGNATLGTTTAPASTSLTLPDLLQVGVSYLASDNLTLNADVEYTWWSTYDKIVVTSSTPIFNQTDEKLWHNTFCLRIGGQYKISDQWKVRAGYLYDQNPVNEEHFETRIPDSDRQGISVGAGFTSGKISVDIASLYLIFSNSQTDNDANPFTPDNSLNGTYKSTAQLAGVTIGYKF